MEKNKIQSLFEKIAAPGYIMLFLFLFMLTTAGLFPLGGAWLGVPEEPGSLDTRITYTPQEVFNLLEEYGAAGRRAYAISHFTLDLIFPLVYVLLFGAWITFFARSVFAPGSRWQRLNLLPVGLFVMDLIENSLIVVLSLSYPAAPVWLAGLSGVVTGIKWGFSGLTVAAAVLTLLAWGIKSTIRQKP